jgi:hypothetical protein
MTFLRSTIVAAGVAAGLGAAFTVRVSAQAPDVRGPLVAVYGGAGAALTVAQPGTDRDIGRTGIIGVELDRLWTAGMAERVSLRFEGGLTSQDLSTAPGPISGDVQTAHLAVLAAARLASSDGREVYAIAGPVWARQSDRFVLDARTTETPGSNFEQTTHGSGGGALLGVGVAWPVGPGTVRAEARWMAVATGGGATQTFPLLVSAVLPVHR